MNLYDLYLCRVLTWIAEVVANRGTSHGAANVTGSRIVKMYKPDVEEFDIIKGYRADDSYTQVIAAFLLNQINISEVERPFYKGPLGNQIFLKSANAFEKISWLDSYEDSFQSEDKVSDMHARREVNRFLSERVKAMLVDGYVATGITAQYAKQHQLIARSGVDAFRLIKDYMLGDYRRYMDTGNPLYMNKTPKQILGSLGVAVEVCPSFQSACREDNTGGFVWKI